MGSSLSPIAADPFMELFEQEALNSANDKPELWVRYVDDTFVIWQHGPDKLELSNSTQTTSENPLIL